MKVSRQVDGVIREYGGKAFLIPISGTTAGNSNAFELNLVAREIWSRLPVDGGVELDAVVDELATVFEVSREVLQSDAQTFLQELAKLGLVDVSADGA